MDADLEALAQELGAALKRRGLMLATAESCTGGWVAATITAVAGSSAWFERGLVTYTNIAKHELLGVPSDALQRHGAVSEPVVRAMAEGALARSHADVTLAITGIAGPAGGTPDKPVGTVWLAWAGKGRATRAQRAHFPGDRAAVRRAAVQAALSGMLDYLA